jgi:hypothetical protein
MGHAVWYCSVCGDGPIADWNPCCTCGHAYCGSCHIEDPYTPKAVQDETKEEDLEQPSKTSYPSNSVARSTIPDRTATPTESLIHSYDDSQSLSQDRADAIQRVLHTISPSQALSEQDDPRSEEAIPMDGPSNPLSRLSPTDGPLLTRPDSEDVSGSYASSRMGNILSSEPEIPPSGVAVQNRLDRAATPLNAETDVAYNQQDTVPV